jgi:hypothetical protein
MAECERRGAGMGVVGRQPGEWYTINCQGIAYKAAPVSPTS